MAFFKKVPKAPQYQDDEPPAPANEPEPQPQQSSGERDATKQLEGEQAHVYLRLLQKLIRAGRPSKFFPDGNALENLAYFMTSKATRGLHDEVQINLRTGLPTEPYLSRVIADKEIASRFLAKHDIPELKTRTDEASERLKRRLEYYRDLSRKDIPKRYNLELKLIRVLDERRIARFKAIFERYDPGEGVFTRYNIELAHEHHRWSRPKIELHGDDLRYTEEFRNVIARYSSDEAEFAFVLLSRVEGITVEEIIRGRIGPLWMEGVSMPAEIQDLMHQHPGNLILNFPEEKVHLTEKEEKVDSNRDPFGRLYRQSLEPEAKAVADARAEKLGYVVHKQRKFSCTPGIVKPFQELLKAAGKPCVVYPVRS